MLDVQDLSYTIGSTTLLKNVTVRFEPGKLNLILGPNGAGKSTFVKLLSRQLAPSSGTLHYDGQPLSSFADNELAKRRAVLSQTTELPFSLKVWEVVLMGRHPHFSGKPKDRDHAVMEEMIALFDLQDLAGRNYLTLSGGEKQRVQFARVMAQLGMPSEEQSKYLILDEPLTFLDVYYQLHFMQQLRALRHPRLIIVGVLHDLHLAAQFGDHLVMMQGGQILTQGTPSQTITSETLAAIFKIKTQVTQYEDTPPHIFYQ